MRGRGGVSTRFSAVGGICLQRHMTMKHAAMKQLMKSKDLIGVHPGNKSMAQFIEEALALQRFSRVVGTVGCPAIRAVVRAVWAVQSQLIQACRGYWCDEASTLSTTTQKAVMFTIPSSYPEKHSIPAPSKVGTQSQAVNLGPLQGTSFAQHQLTHSPRVQIKQLPCEILDVPAMQTHSRLLRLQHAINKFQRKSCSPIAQWPNANDKGLTAAIPNR